MSLGKKSPAKKKESKKTKFSHYRQNILGGSFVIVVAIAGIFIGISLYEDSDEKESIFTIAAIEGLNYIGTLEYYDPDSESAFIINQIAEGLLDYTVTSKGADFFPNLADDWEWSTNATELTCYLKRGIEFHDGMPFNATAVKWNFDRISRLLNVSGYPNIWLHADGVRILNETIVLDNNTVKFVLNRPYIPFEALLGCSQAYILSPSSTPANDFVDLEAGLVGTGPFIYESSFRIYDPLLLDEFKFINFNTTLVANSDYWEGKPKIDKIILKVYSNHTLRKDAINSGDIDYSMLWPYQTEDYSNIPSLSLETFFIRDVYFVTMDNNVINKTMRKAISYALDYDRLLSIQHPRWEGGVVRCESPISKGLSYSNWSAFDVPIYNITKARKALLEVNWPGTMGLIADNNITIGNNWELIANSSTPLASYNFSYIIGNQWRTSLTNTFSENLKQIGVKIIPIGITWPEFSIEKSEFHYAGLAPDFSYPSQNIHPLFSNKLDGYYNFFNFNDTTLQQWMEEALVETNETARELLYYGIQERLIEELYPVIWYYTPLGVNVQSHNIRGIDYLTAPYKVLVKNVYFT